MQVQHDPLDSRTLAAVFGDPDLHIRVEPFEAGMTWWKEAWAIYTRAPLTWSVLTVIFVALCFLVALIPLVGYLLSSILQVVFVGGLCIGGNDLAEGRPMGFDTLFAGFRSTHLMRLSLVAVILLLGFFVYFLLIGIVCSWLGLVFNAGSVHTLNDLITPTLWPFLVGATIGLTVYSMCAWFAPVLVVLHGVNALESVRLSFAACMKNWVAMLAFGIVALLVLLAGMITVGIGFFVIAPVAMATMVTSARSVFGRGHPRAEDVLPE